MTTNDREEKEEKKKVPFFLNYATHASYEITNLMREGGDFRGQRGGNIKQTMVNTYMYCKKKKRKKKKNSVDFFFFKILILHIYLCWICM